MRLVSLPETCLILDHHLLKFGLGSAYLPAAPIRDGKNEYARQSKRKSDAGFIVSDSQPCTERHEAGHAPSPNEEEGGQLPKDWSLRPPAFRIECDFVEEAEHLSDPLSGEGRYHPS